MFESKVTFLIPLVGAAFFWVCESGGPLAVPLDTPPSPVPGSDEKPFVTVTVAVPDIAMAEKFATDLVTLKYVATVNIHTGSQSIYTWDNKVRKLPEMLVSMMTHTSKYKKIEEYIVANHVHIEPGIVVTPIVSGSPSFLTWINETTNEDAAGPDAGNGTTTKSLLGAAKLGKLLL